jgi:hypothetical protein
VLLPGEIYSSTNKANGFPIADIAWKGHVEDEPNIADTNQFVSDALNRTATFMPKRWMGESCVRKVFGCAHHIFDIERKEGLNELDTFAYVTWMTEHTK